MGTPVFVSFEPINGEARMLEHDALRLTDAEDAAGVTPVNYAFQEGHVERYEQWSSSSTDFTAAFQRVATVARNKPGLVIQFTPGRTYSVWPSGSGSTLFDLNGATGVIVQGNGALLSAGDVDASTPYVFDLLGAQGVDIRNLRYQQSYTTLDSANGARFFVIRQGSHRIKIRNCEQTGGQAGIIVLGEQTSDAPRSDQISAVNCTFTNVYYPQNFQASGDQYFARGIKTINCGRGYFPYNVRQHDVEMFSQPGGPFDDAILTVYADSSGTYNKLEQIRLRYFSDGRHSSASDQSSGQSVITFAAQQANATTAAAEFNDIDIQVRFEPQADPTTERLVNFRKLTSAGAADTAARGHLFANIRISGMVRSWANATGPACIDIFGTADGYNWTGDGAANITVRDLYASGDPSQIAIAINGQPFGAETGVRLENVFTDMLISRTNWNEQHAFSADNVVSASLVASGAYVSYTPSWTGSTGNPTLGNGSLIGRYTRRGDRVKGYVELTYGSTTANGTGSIRFSLPVTAAAGEGDQLGEALVLDAGTRFYNALTLISSGGTYLELYAENTGAAMTFASPFSPANGDKFRIAFDYIASP